MLKKKYLIVISSACQMNSGIGRIVFDWIDFAKEYFEISLLIDTYYIKNTIYTVEKCKQSKVPCYLSDAFVSCDACDTAPADIPKILQQEKWDFVECYSWANSVTNKFVLKNISKETALLFSPSTQPLHTIGDKKFYSSILNTLENMLLRSELVFTITKNEISSHYKQFEVDYTSSKFVNYGHGVHEKFCYKIKSINKSVLSIFDMREHRKRADLHFYAIENISEKSIFFEIGGSARNADLIPNAIKSKTKVLPFLPEEELIDKYQTAGVFLLISDYEAFGLPIAEALCCGCPVIINNQPELIDIYSDLPGVYFVNNTESRSVALVIHQVICKDHNRKEISRAAQQRFAFKSTYGIKLKAVLALSKKEDINNPSQHLQAASLEHTSYSQEGTDRILSYFLTAAKIHFSDVKYIDLGAANPIGHNNTYFFYQYGAQGLLVEADPMYHSEYAEKRPRDKRVNCAIVPQGMEQGGTVTFYRMKIPGWSTIKNDNVASEQIEKVITVPALTFANILNEYWDFDDIDILSIDLEGIEEQVLYDFDFNRFNPKMIVYEKGNIPHQDIFTSPLSVFLASKDYILIATTFINIIYMRRDVFEKCTF